MIDPGACVGTVIIGRNEGDRFLACLASLNDDIKQIVYVDSGSTDGSVKAAVARGAEVVTLNTDIPFTAARARNAGIAALGQGKPPEFVQFIDGDCALVPDWTLKAIDFLKANPNVAVVCGRRCERFPNVSIYNRMCDVEWNTTPGEALTCGGDALMRWDALDAVGGYDPSLIAGEEPEMCLRIRRLGWKIWRLDADMTVHDAAITKFRQFWNRMRRGGHATAEGMAMYGKDPERLGVSETLRSLRWGVAVPVGILVGCLIFGPVALWLLIIYPAQIVQLAVRDGGDRFAWGQAVLLMVGKSAESLGILNYFWRNWNYRQSDQKQP